MNLFAQGLMVFLATYGLLVLVSDFGQSLHAWSRSRRLPFVSLVLLVRDQEATVEGLVTDILSIDYRSARGSPNYELVVVDDRSVDSTPIILERLAQQHAALRVVRLAEAGSPGQTAADLGLFLSHSPAALVLDARRRNADPRLLEAAEYLLGRRRVPSGQTAPAGRVSN